MDLNTSFAGHCCGNSECHNPPSNGRARYCGTCEETLGKQCAAWILDPNKKPLHRCPNPIDTSVRPKSKVRKLAKSLSKACIARAAITSR